MYSTILCCKEYFVQISNCFFLYLPGTLESTLSQIIPLFRVTLSKESTVDQNHFAFHERNFVFLSVVPGETGQAEIYSSLIPPPPALVRLQSPVLLALASTVAGEADLTTVQVSTSDMQTVQVNTSNLTTYQENTSDLTIVLVNT